MDINIKKIILFTVVGCLFIMSLISCMQQENTNEPNYTTGSTELINDNIVESTSTTTSTASTDNTTKTEPTVAPTTEPIIIPTTEPMTEAIEETNPKLISLGKFKLTAYCSCKKCCGKWADNRPLDENGNEIIYGAIGVPLVEGISIAVDPKVIPYRSEVIINGHTYVAHDCGGAIKGNRIDVYFENHEDAWDFGVQYAEVFLVVEK